MRWFDARNASNTRKTHQFKDSRQVFPQKNVLYIDEGLPRLRYGRVPDEKDDKWKQKLFPLNNSPSPTGSCSPWYQ